MTPRRALPAACLVAAYLLTLAALHDRAWDGVRAAERAAHASDTWFEGWVEVVGDPQPSLYRTRAVVKAAGRHLLATATRPASSALVVVEARDRIHVRGRVAPLPASEAGRWQRRHVGAALEIDAIDGLRSPTHPLWKVSALARSLVLGGAGRLPYPERAVVAAFLVGDTRAIPDASVDDFRASGLSHLLAVSGANVAFVLALTAPLTRGAGLRGRLGAALATILLFAAVTRFEPSVLRASAMAAIAAVAVHAGRPASGRRVLTLAAGALLLLDPFLVYSAGFRLSCAASLGIILWSRPLAARLRGPEPLREALAVTLAAQVAVTPLLIPLFGSVPLASIPANALAAPLAAPLTMWGVASGLASSVLVALTPEAAALLQLPTLLLARAVMGVAHAGAALPWSLGSTGALGAVAAACAVAATRAARRDGIRPGATVERDGPTRPVP